MRKVPSGFRQSLVARSRISIIAAGFAALFPGKSALAEEVRVEPGNLPVVVRQVLAAKYPGWAVVGVTQTEVNGKIEYTLRLADETMEIDSVLDEGGHIIEAARGIELAAASQQESPKWKNKKGKKGKKKKFGKPKLYGFAQVFYRDAFNTGIDNVVDNDNFRVQRVRLGVKGDISSWASYEIEIDPRAPEISGILRDAFLRLTFVPFHQIRIGQQKTQFGYENRKSSTELFAVNRAEISDALGRGLNLRDLGVGLIGSIPLNAAWAIEDAITVVNGAGINVQNDDTGTKNVWGRLGLRHGDGSSWERIGISGGTGDFVDPGDPLDPEDDILEEFDRIGLDLEIDRKWFFFGTEYMYGVEDTTEIGLLPKPAPVRSHLDGYYFNLVGKTPWHVGPIVRYDVFDTAFARWTFGAYYGDAKDRFRVMLNYEYREKFEDADGNIGRGDDKLYLWTQLRF